MALPHEVLGVAENADEATINAAFRRAAKQYHPDLNGGSASGARHLRRLIAARDFLTKPQRRLPNAPGVRLLQKPRSRQKVLFAYALTGAASLLVVSVLVAQTAGHRPKIGAVEKAATLAADAGLPDAGSAEIKAIRDMQEAIGYRRVEMDMEAAQEPRLQGAVRRHRSMPPANQLRKAIMEAAFLMSKTFRKLASAQ